ncbi:hypothetical protein KIW84_041074 [Lathyrus oleraceus]|uniref:Pentatricopeptide repeat-containing protein n=1 Tax=Pisum sativum TaxID=3888 RepID=A0A9D5ANV7_PEA|nr:hypothetical protein KIW84_041074 [Pisum sativum]
MLPISKPFVLHVLCHGGYNNKILLCLKFFDWASLQPRFIHTRAIFVAIFRILTQASYVLLVLEFLQTLWKHVITHRVHFDDTLVVVYANAGKPDVALHMFGKMRFQWLDLDGISYRILLNALAREDYFNAFSIILSHIRMKGYTTSVTDVIVVKFFYKQGKLNEAKDYLNCLLGSGKETHGFEVNFLLGSLLPQKPFFLILSTSDDLPSLSSLLLPISKPFVLHVLCHGGYNNKILLCLKFFDWASLQPRFIHTRAIFVAIFRILTQASYVLLVLEFLQTLWKHVITHRVHFDDTLVVVYANAGKPDVALHMFGKMRFQWLDLDGISYRILLNALAREDYFNAFSIILSHIRMKGYTTSVTDVIVVKFFYKQGKLNEAKDYLNCLLGSGKETHGFEVNFLLGSLLPQKPFFLVSYKEIDNGML